MELFAGCYQAFGMESRGKGRNLRKFRLMIAVHQRVLSLVPVFLFEELAHEA